MYIYIHIILHRVIPTSLWLSHVVSTFSPRPGHLRLTGLRRQRRGQGRAQGRHRRRGSGERRGHGEAQGEQLEIPKVKGKWGEYSEKLSKMRIFNV